MFQLHVTTRHTWKLWTEQKFNWAFLKKDLNLFYLPDFFEEFTMSEIGTVELIFQKDFD